MMKECNHEILYNIGRQETGRPGEYVVLGNCLRCESTRAIMPDKYVRIDETQVRMHLYDKEQNKYNTKSFGLYRLKNVRDGLADKVRDALSNVGDIHD